MVELPATTPDYGVWEQKRCQKIINEKLFAVARKCLHRFWVARKRYVSQINCRKKSDSFFFALQFIFSIGMRQREEEWMSSIFALQIKGRKTERERGIVRAVWWHPDMTDALDERALTLRRKQSARKKKNPTRFEQHQTVQKKVEE